VYVDKPIIQTAHGKICQRLAARLRACAARLGAQVFAADDAAARRLGWQVTAVRGGLGRRYRDPRFDGLVACSRCGGRGGRSRGAPCAACAGTGRIVLDLAAGFPPRMSA
jgi:hypothetical protein